MFGSRIHTHQKPGGMCSRLAIVLSRNAGGAVGM
jgi:hypothetical protein